ncbi:hypothetical protein TNCV_960491 [Trichonephila clavipes]|nr:hypothetical protein TNCV_960491 [Trichonephila clavipes]
MRGKIQERANSSAPRFLGDEVWNKKRNAPNFGQRRSPRFTALERWKITGPPRPGTSHKKEIQKHVISTPQTDSGGQGNLVVKVTDSWPACHEFEPSINEKLPCRGEMYVKSVKAQRSFRWCGLEVRRGGTSSGVIQSFDHGSKFKGPSSKALE